MPIKSFICLHFHQILKMTAITYKHGIFHTRAQHTNTARFFTKTKTKKKVKLDKKDKPLTRRSAQVSPSFEKAVTFPSAQPLAYL